VRWRDYRGWQRLYGCPAKKGVEEATMTNYDLDHHQRLREAYEARRGEQGFDEKKLTDMVSGCARRRTLRDGGLTPEQAKGVREVIENEHPDLWK
jgi:hypothetical protein